MVPNGATVMPPEPATSFGSVVVKEWNNRKFPQQKADSVVFDYSLTTYKAENCTIPPLTYVVETQNKQDTLRTETIPLKVIALCTSDSVDIADLKPQQTTGSRPLWWLWAALATAAVIAAIIVVLKYRKQKSSGAPIPPPKPPYEEALAALAALEAKQLLQKGMVREFVFELSDILKRYIERTFTINAAEFTTEEMLAWLAISPLDKERRNSMEWFFRNTDPVKFAKYLPDRATIDRFGGEVRGFLESTKPAESGQKEPPAPVAPPGPAPTTGGTV
jgi:hypothetical protein